MVKRKLSVSVSSDPVPPAETGPSRPKRACAQTPGNTNNYSTAGVRYFCQIETDEPEEEAEKDNAQDVAVEKDMKKLPRSRKAMTDKEKADKQAVDDIVKSSPVPTLPALPVDSKNKRSLRGQAAKNFDHTARRVQFWKRHAPTYRIPGVTLNNLQSRPRSIKDKEAAELTAKEMEHAPADAGSMIITDGAGTTLACVFALRQKPAADAPLKSHAAESKVHHSGQLHPVYPGPEGRTYQDYENLGKKGIVYDGIGKTTLDDYHHAVHNLHSIMPPVANAADIRHPHDRVMEYTHAKTGEKTLERTGVTHLVHKWHQQGHPKGNMTCSADMNGRGSTTRAEAVVKYFSASHSTATLLAAMFKEAYPEYFKKYEAAFKKGVWRAEDPGPWLGRALVWKLQVDCHRDGLDDGPAAIFSCGDFEGGALYLTDLKIKLHYGPGDVVIFMAGALYHAVSMWKPALKQDSKDLTPGRVGNVFFFPKASYKKLAGKLD